MELDWTQALAIIGSNIALLLGSIGISLTIFFKGNDRVEEHRKETMAILKGIQEEMKDFHGRLCAIEERKKMEK